VWLFEALGHGFQYSVPDWRLQWFRIIFAAACLLKFTVSLSHGGFDRMAPGSLGRFQLCAAYGARRGLLLARAYRPTLLVRCLAALGVFLGIGLRAAIVLVLAGLLFELTYAFRYNTVYLALLSCCLLVAGDPGTGFAVSSAVSNDNTWTQFLIVFITIDLYWNSAWQKVRSAHFHDGILLAQFVHFIAQVRHRLRYREFFYPTLMIRYLGMLDERAVRRWRYISRAVIVAEFVIPIALMCPPLYPYAVATGIIMHACFTMLMPRQLMGFSIATAGTYLLFPR
jgi:hypothetical protein